MSPSSRNGSAFVVGAYWGTWPALACERLTPFREIGTEKAREEQFLSHCLCATTRTRHAHHSRERPCATSLTRGPRVRLLSSVPRPQEVPHCAVELMETERLLSTAIRPGAGS